MGGQVTLSKALGSRHIVNLASIELLHHSKWSVTVSVRSITSMSQSLLSFVFYVFCHLLHAFCVVPLCNLHYLLSSCPTLQCLGILCPKLGIQEVSLSGCSSSFSYFSFFSLWAIFSFLPCPASVANWCWQFPVLQLDDSHTRASHWPGFNQKSSY